MIEFIFKNPYIYVFLLIFGGYYMFEKMGETPNHPSEEMMVEFNRLLENDKYKEISITKCIKIKSGFQGNPPAYECAVKYVAKDSSKTPDGTKIDNFVYAPLGSAGEYEWTANFLTDYTYYDDIPTLARVHK